MRFGSRSLISSSNSTSYDNMSKGWRRQVESIYRRGPTQEEAQDAAGRRREARRTLGQQAAQS